ncbi:hypothetical protein [Hoylesella shahii]|uniref:hypothetical protein n=1 Tax=Hoylesella shahii TaxID=228603 RepID=UPI0028E20D52|nr:hypothetical protein [Hoylesella shahii]
MEICKTDAKTILRFLTDAATFYDAHAKGFVEKDRPRLLRNMAKKLSKSLKETINQ